MRYLPSESERIISKWQGRKRFKTHEEALHWLLRQVDQHLEQDAAMLKKDACSPIEVTTMVKK